MIANTYLYVALQLRKDPGKGTVGEHWYKITERFHNEVELLDLEAGNAHNVASIIYKSIDYAMTECENCIVHVGKERINEEVAGKYFLFVDTPNMVTM